MLKFKNMLQVVPSSLQAELDSMTESFFKEQINIDLSEKNSLFQSYVPL